jgi:deoxyribonuclease-4
MQIGLKIWSTNDYYIESAIDLFKKNIFDYIELYMVPESLEYLRLWKALEIPYVLHAPHSLSGLNPSLRTNEEANFKLISELQEYNDSLKPEFIIFHPGLDGKIEETIRQFCLIRDKYPLLHESMIVENKPKVGINMETCIGATPMEIYKIMTESGIRFCMDIGHAICASNTLKLDSFQFLKDFLKLEPVMFHLSDGENQFGKR